MVATLLIVDRAMALEIQTNPIDNQFSLISFNLYNRSINRDERMEASAEILKAFNADIIALQEVSQGWFLGRNPVDIINKALGYHWQVFYFENFPPIWQNGLAVLSRWPIKTIQKQAFSVNRFFNIKGFHHVRVNAPFGDIDLINLHMAATQRESVKLPEFEQLIQYVNSLESPVIILGDFNERRGSKVLPLLKNKIKVLESIYQVIDLSDKNTHASYGESCLSPEGSRLDYVYYDKSAYTLKTGDILQPYNEPPVSDHCMINTTFQLTM